MSQTATIKSLARAFRMMKAMQSDGIEWGDDYRHAGAAALKDVLEGQMANRIDRHLDEMAARAAADRRNGSYRRWLMTSSARSSSGSRARGPMARLRWCAPTPGGRPISTA